MANVSSGTSLNTGILGVWLVEGLRILSTDSRLLSQRSEGSPALSFLDRFRRSISSCPLSKVKVRNAEIID